MGDGRKYEHCPVWDYWAKAKSLGPIKPYTWRQGDAEREAWAAAMVAVARRRARAVIVREIEAGRWWVPSGFTVADLDALLAERYSG